MITMGTTQADLAKIGKDINAIFRQLIGMIGTQPGGFDGIWKCEFDRFDLWANNLGLHHTGHSSLDYRLRDADNLRDYVKGLLDELKETLEECSQ